MIGYFMVILVLAGIGDFYGGRLISTIVLIAGTYLGVFMIFKENGLFIIVYNIMAIIALAVLLIWILKAIIQGVRNEKPPVFVSFGEFVTESGKLGLKIAGYGLIMVMMGGSSDNEFGPLSIVTVLGNLGTIEGLLVLVVGGIVIAVLSMIIRHIIIKFVYSIKGKNVPKVNGLLDKLFKTKIFNKLFPNQELYTDLEINYGVVNEFPGMDYNRLPKEVTVVICDNGHSRSRNGKKWIKSENTILDDYV